MREHTTTILLAISATLIALSLYIFGVPMLNTFDVIGHMLATCGLLLGAFIIIALAIIWLRSDIKGKSKKDISDKTSNHKQISVNISVNCNAKSLSEVKTFLKELDNKGRRK
jgi:hypothetical protein